MPDYEELLDGTVDEVNDYLDDNPDEAEAVLAAEAAGKNRKGIVEGPHAEGDEDDDDDAAEDEDGEVEATAEVGLPGSDYRDVVPGLTEVDDEGVERAKGDTNGLLTGVTSDMVNPAFRAVDDRQDDAEDGDEA